MKNLSKLVAGFLAILLSVTMVACTGTENVSAVGGGEEFDDSALIIDSVDDPSPIELVEPEPEPAVADPEPELQSEPEEPEEQPKVDPNEELTWQFLEVDEDWYKEYQGMGLRREGKLYSLSDGVPVQNWYDTKLCVKTVGGCTNCKGDMGYDTIIPDDRFVIPAVTANDDVAWYGKDAPASITFIPMNFYGYTINVLQDTDKCEALSIVVDPEYCVLEHYRMIYYYKDKDFMLCDAKGTEVSDIRKLNHGDVYKATWEDNGDQEYTTVANWVYYKADENGAIKLEGQPTEDPEITSFDLSDLPKGTYYMVESYAMVTIE